jgi:hypothetical protein
VIDAYLSGGSRAGAATGSSSKQKVTIRYTHLFVLFIDDKCFSKLQYCFFVDVWCREARRLLGETELNKRLDEDLIRRTAIHDAQVSILIRFVIVSCIDNWLETIF